MNSAARYHSEVIERTAPTPTHGRYLVLPPAVHGPAPMLVGFHGYAEDAETQLERLRGIPGSSEWLCLSIQALHRFYQRRGNQVVASWMTRQDRDFAISDNLTWVAGCIEAVTAEWPVSPEIVFAGFSQGVAMAYRAAGHSNRSVAGVIAVGGDTPPELGPQELGAFSSVLIARGDSDPLYSKEKFTDDERRLRECALRIQVVEFDGGHEWSPEVTGAAARFLQGCRG